MNLDKVLSRKLNPTIYKDIKPRKKQVISKEQRDKSDIRRVIRLIKTGDYDATSPHHKMKLSLAVKAGYIDKNTLEILKED